MVKRLLRSRGGQWGVSWLIAALIRLTGATIRWQHATPAAADRLFRDELPIITVFWHNRIMLMTEFWRLPAPLAMLQSPHPDGRLIARAIQRLGFTTVWGSSTRGRGGATGLRNLVRVLRGGCSVGITPDGPRGPRMRLGPGVVAVARLSGRPIVPLAWSVAHRRVLNSWDRFILARPFSRGIFVVGEPIRVPATLDAAEQEAWRRLVEDRLNQVSAQADRHFGHDPIPPASAPTVPEAPPPESPPC